MKNDSSIIRWNGVESRNWQWNRNLKLKDAFHYSCVPCYQQIARKIGAKRMNEYIAKFDYGNMEIDSSNVDMFWLVGESTISQMEQIEFLRKLYLKKLPIRDQTMHVAKRMMIIEQNESYVLSGKTGRSKDGMGWFVGFLETGEKVYFFATNVEPREKFNVESRKRVTLNALKKIKAIE